MILKPSKTFCLVEVIKVKKRQGVRSIILAWTFENAGISTEARCSLVPQGITKKRSIAQVIEWVNLRHNRAHKLTVNARAVRVRDGGARVVHDSIVLHAAEKLREKLYREED